MELVNYINNITFAQNCSLCFVDMHCVNKFGPYKILVFFIDLRDWEHSDCILIWIK